MAVTDTYYTESIVTYDPAVIELNKAFGEALRNRSLQLRDGFHVVTGSPPEIYALATQKGQPMQGITVTGDNPRGATPFSYSR